ncbi:hypothetical protein, conserved [Plasmodium gonderi]|uniref:Uncharacterized protein n=1 Tax=Plasmodium gonderi TaxID=77519 RepID=A0A1Y1JDB5_PLAGO|nr:hypothetical protein, conserved [Plasmodium gonderi]GAW80476.1 hypothetical protein, conserved [Plasmodium gonderi]
MCPLNNNFTTLYRAHISLFCQNDHPAAFEKGIKSLINVLFKILIFNLYYSFDKIKECVGVNIGERRDTEINNIQRLDKSKRNIEKFINLCLVILKTLKGDSNFFTQYVLENYSSINLSHNNERTKGKKKIKTKFDNAFLMFHLYNNSQLSRWNNRINDIIKGIDLNVGCVEKHNVYLGDKEVNSYVNKIVTIERYIDKHKMYSKKDFISKLNNFLNDFYLKKNPTSLDNDVLNKTKKGKEKNLIDDDYVMINLFSEYFNNCRRKKKLINILIKEVNLQSLKNFHHILCKNINFIRIFNMQNDDKHDMDAIQLSTLFEF